MKVRFAPSPTGFLHIGNARTALFNYLHSSKHHGKYILRIEDTDLERSRKEYITQIYEDLHWLGIQWDEGPDVGGPSGPYLQSERFDIYNDYVKKLMGEKKAYYCYCSPETLEALRKEQAAQGQLIKYDNRCRHLTETDHLEKHRQGIKPSIRFQVNPGEVVVDDLIRGEVVFDTNTLGDFIIIRPDGTPTFHLSVSIDDGLMEITHVLRGEDHLSNTPKHLLLMKAMGFRAPQYAHMPLTMGQAGEPLSKRLGAMSIAEYRKLGYRSEALCNYMSLLGWAPGDDREIFTMEELKEAFSVKRVSKSPAIFDKVKLDWVSGCHIRALDEETYFKEAMTYAVKEGIVAREDFEKRPEWYRKVLAIFKDNLSFYAQLKDRLSIFSENFQYEDAAILTSDSSRAVLKACQDALFPFEFLDEAAFDALMKQVKKESGQKGKELFFPLRMALTGTLHGPELKQVMILLTKAGCLRRIEKALEFQPS